ncbi:helix-turn-helix domain-containing protein [Cellulosimicrobium cellulans]|uniref:helix-turn-helix domain-containing protein n=1 Tax=Cellulosimicrobium cellulans TaxID=1710 RepID=UPI001BA5423A|nr:helix-turn-helix domain-containing protein [Cellulosimicrobium cellulans]
MPTRAHRHQHQRRSGSARARGRVGSRKPRLSRDQAELAQQLYDSRTKTVQQIADMFGVARITVYGHLNTNQRPDTQPRS